MNTYKNLKQQSLGLALIYIVVTLIGLAIIPGPWVPAITTPLLLVGLSWRLYRALHRQIGEQQFNEFRQFEALQALYTTLEIRQPLPRTRHTAASPDFLHLLANEIFRLKPEIIVEVGSGTSTLIAAYCLKNIGRGKIISLDHLEKYADITRQTIVDHDLEDFASVRHAPLKTYDIDGDSYQWYDDTTLDQLNSIDLLIVDGPPQNVSQRARYPALPLLKDKLHSASVLLLDDGARADETEIVETWRQRYGLDFRVEATEKGAFSCRFPEQ